MKNFILNLTIFLFLALIPVSVFGQVAGDEKGGDSGNKVTRVGVLIPKVALKDATGEVDPAEALRSTYASLLNSENFELVALQSKLSSLAITEAAELECDYILSIDLKQEEKKSGGGLFGKVLRDTTNTATWEAANRVPYGSNTGERIARDTARSAIINTGYSMSDVSVTIKKNDQFNLNYGLSTAKGEVVKSKNFEAKAKKNNDDTLLMALIEQSANDIAETLLARRAQ
ncbi:MAG: hypothetical protein R2684_01915 [Pyrinomonadaceae bacterium]